MLTQQDDLSWFPRHVTQRTSAVAVICNVHTGAVFDEAYELVCEKGTFEMNNGERGERKRSRSRQQASAPPHKYVFFPEGVVLEMNRLCPSC